MTSVNRMASPASAVVRKSIMSDGDAKPAFSSAWLIRGVVYSLSWGVMPGFCSNVMRKHRPRVGSMSMVCHPTLPCGMPHTRLNVTPSSLTSSHLVTGAGWAAQMLR